MSPDGPVLPAADAKEQEATLLKQLRAGEAAAWERFVRQAGGPALALARRLLRHEPDAADVVQESFLSFFKSLDGFHGDARLSTWLHRIVLNNALMKIRSRSRHPQISVEDLLPRFREDGHRLETLPAWTQTPADFAEDEELRALVHRQIARLPQKYRNVLILRDIQEMSTADAARRLGARETAVKTRLHRARQALRRLLEQELVR